MADNEVEEIEVIEEESDESSSESSRTKKLSITKEPEGKQQADSQFDEEDAAARKKKLKGEQKQDVQDDAQIAANAALLLLKKAMEVRKEPASVIDAVLKRAKERLAANPSEIKVKLHRKHDKPEEQVQIKVDDSSRNKGLKRKR
jgi:hypothetical protein